MNTKNEREEDKRVRERAAQIILAADGEELDRIIAIALQIIGERQEPQDDQRGI